jgi:hypothetical protein
LPAANLRLFDRLIDVKEIFLVSYSAVLCHSAQSLEREEIVVSSFYITA